MVFRELRDWAHTPLATVVAAYPALCRPERVEELVRAGLSGAEIYRLTTPLGTLCLRRWPSEHPDLELLRYMHDLLRHLHSSGFRRVAVPLGTNAGESFVQYHDHFWELTPWLPGAADWRTRPNPPRIAAALRALAEFHLAAANFRAWGDRAGRSRNLKRRRRQALPDLADEWRAQELRREAWPELAALVPRFCSAYEQVWPELIDSLTAASYFEVGLQVCLRDIWHENVLFEGDEVSGLVDFGALAEDSVGIDVARLLGSMAGDDRDLWSIGLEAYRAVRPLRWEEAAIVAASDRSFVALAGFQWLDWIVLERREFSDRARVLERLTEILSRLENWAKAC